MEELTIIDF